MLFTISVSTEIRGQNRDQGEVPENRVEREVWSRPPLEDH